MLIYHITCNKWHDCCKGIETAHPVVVAFFVNGVHLLNLLNILRNPFSVEFLSQNGRFVGTHFSDTSGSAAQVRHEGALQIFCEHILSKDGAQISNKLKDFDSNPPVSIAAKSLEKWNKCTQQILISDTCNFSESLDDVQFDLRVLLLQKIGEDWENLGHGELLTENRTDVAESFSCTRSKLTCAILVNVQDGWEQEFADFAIGEAIETGGDVADGSESDFKFIVTKKNTESLNKVIIGDLLAEGLGKQWEIPSKGQLDLPRFVLTGCQKSTKGVNLVLLFGEDSCHGNQGLEAHDSDGILLILTQLTENGQDLLKNVLLFEFGGEDTELLGTCSTNNSSVLVAKLDELLTELLLLSATGLVTDGEKFDGADSSGEGVTGGQLDHQWSKHVLNLSVGEMTSDSNERFGCLFTDHCLIMTAQLVETPKK